MAQSYRPAIIRNGFNIYFLWIGLDIPDIEKEVVHLVSQVPRGKVSTYSIVASALGDVRAARFVSEIVKNLDPESGSYRIIYKNGTIQQKSDVDVFNLLSKDGITVIGGTVSNMEDHLFRDFTTSHPLRKLRNRQKKIANLVSLKPCHKIDDVAGIDISYYNNEAFGTAAVYSLKEHRYEEPINVKAKIEFPYIPTYLYYREFPIIELITKQLDRDCVLLIDGNGILHPYRVGIASQLGVELNRVTIGVAKSLLCGNVKRIPTRPMERTRITINGKLVGYCLRPGINRKIVYISPGNNISIKQAVNINVKLFKETEIHPLRKAHILSRKIASDRKLRVTRKY